MELIKWISLAIQLVFGSATFMVSNEKPTELLGLMQNKLNQQMTDSTIYMNSRVTEIKTLRNSFAKNLANMLFSKMKALTAIRRQTLEQYPLARYDENFRFLNARTEKNMTRIETHFSTKVKVSINASFNYVPYDIYERSRDILMAAKYTKDLDITFAENYREDRTLTWQYFCSQEGLWRNYPGFWKDKYT